ARERAGPDAGPRTGTPAAAGSRQPRVHGPALVDRYTARPRRKRGRAVSAAASARRRRHGRGLAGRALRWPVPAPGRAEAAAQWRRRSGPAPALRPRAADPGPPAAPAPGTTAGRRGGPAR